MGDGMEKWSVVVWGCMEGAGCWGTGSGLYK